MNAQGSERLGPLGAHDAPTWVVTALLLGGIGLTAAGLLLLWTVFLGSFAGATWALLGWLVILAVVMYSWLKVAGTRELSEDLAAARGAATTEEV